MTDNTFWGLKDLTKPEEFTEYYYQTCIDIAPMALEDLDRVCDGASSDDGQGFAGQHTRNGKRLAKATRAGYKWQPHDVRWLENNLPYYMNTQLQWIDQIQFKIGINYWKYIAEINRAIYVCEKYSNKINNLIIWRNDTTVIQYYKTFPLDNVNKNDYNFMSSLQIVAKGGTLTKRQIYWMKKMMLKYGDQ